MERFKTAGKIKTGTGNKIGISAVMAVSGCILLMISPSLSVAAAEKGIQLWLFTVIPSLLPFFVFTDMIVKSGLHIKAGSLFEKPVRFIMGTHGVSAFAFITSLISGYPAGARVIGELRRNNEIDDMEVSDMLSFCSTSGPLFIVGAVGTGMLGSATAGYVILVSHYISSVITGIFYAENSILNRKDKLQKRRTENRNRYQYNNPGGGTPRGFADIMGQSILSAFKTMFIIGGYIVIFSVITEYICHFMPGLLNMVFKIIPAGVSGNLSAVFGNSADFMVTVASGILEMTVGCGRIAAFQGISLDVMMIVCSFFVSFGGISVAAQSMSVLEGCDIKMTDFLKMKFFQGIVSAAVTMGIIWFI
ncbi:MAG: hypothetical protein IKV96_01280 [Firmicutes bacterium]|nr:hypothetical protein [Bacillota bacterium]